MSYQRHHTFTTYNHTIVPGPSYHHTLVVQIMPATLFQELPRDTPIQRPWIAEMYDIVVGARTICPLHEDLHSWLRRIVLVKTILCDSHVSACCLKKRAQKPDCQCKPGCCRTLCGNSSYHVLGRSNRILIYIDIGRVSLA